MARAGDGAPRLAVLGGGGRVGRLLVPALDALAAAPLVQSRRDGARIDWAADPEQDELGLRLRAWAPDLVVVLWGATSGSSEDLRANTTLPVMALRAAKEAAVPAVAVMSSAAVYGTGRPGPYTENDVPDAANTYGQAKLDMERALLRLWAELGDGAPALSLLRLANVVGADLLGQAVGRADSAEPLRLDRFADGRGPRRSYLGPATLARVCLALAEAPAEGAPEILNVADGSEPVAMEALIGAMSATGRPVPWRWREASPAAVPEVALDTCRLAARMPEVAAHFRRGARELVSDWIAVTETAA